MGKSKIVLDTNVLISAILFGGKPRIILEKVRTGALLCFLSPAILDELRDVLCRPKFGFSDDAAFRVVEELQAICDIVFPEKTLSVVDENPDDNRILECAVEAQAEIVVLGDPHLLALTKYGKIRILSPADFLAAFEER